MTVNVHKRPVARIVPFKVDAPLSDLTALAGVRWNGRKPAGLPKGETLRNGVSLSACINEDRR